MILHSYEKIKEIAQTYCCLLHPEARLRAIWIKRANWVEDDLWTVWCEGEKEGHYPEQNELKKNWR